MDKGLAYTYSSIAFPRYHYFRTRLHRLLPRLHNILEAGGLPDCVSQGRTILKKISAAAEHITDEVTVNLFADAVLLNEQKLDLPEQKTKISEARLQWTGYVKSLTETNEFQPTVTVIVSQSEEKVQDECCKLTEDQQEGVILFDVPSKTAVLYTDLDQRSRHSEPVKRSLVQQVQYVLERKVMAVLEMIAGYNQEFIPRREEEVDSSLLDAIHVMLIESLRNPFVVKDLSPNSEAILGEKIPTDSDISFMSPYIAREWQRVAEVLGTSKPDLDRIKLESNSDFERSSHVLRIWRKREGDHATLNYLLKLLKGVKVDVSSFESSFLALGSDQKKDEIFKKKLTDFVVNKTKCVVCDTLTRKFGISASIINEFLNEGFFDYKAKVLELLGTMNMPTWPRDRTDDGVSTCRVFSYRCGMNMTKLIHSMEDYIKSKLNILIVLKKLQFELHGYLSQAKVPISTSVPELPKLPVNLQFELLSLDEVTGCGTCYGELVLHVNKMLYPARKEEIKQILQEYNYNEGYKYVMMSEQTEQVRTIPQFVELGHELRAQFVGSHGNYNHGSLGCFFNLRPKHDEHGVSQQNTGAMVSSGYEISEAKDHCLTCAHCFINCEVNVEARFDRADPFPGFRHLGTRKCFIYKPQAVDVASVEVADDILERCDSRLKNSKVMYVPNWQVFDVDPIRRDVHKEGCASGFTKGLVMSTDYMTKKIREINSVNFKKTGSLEGGLQTIYNILIESLPGAGELAHVISGEAVEHFEVSPFSCEGDSGSVVIADEADDTSTVNVVALLIGAVSENNIFRHSYASLMKRTIEEIEVQYDCIAIPSTLYPRDRQGEIGPIGAGNA